MVTRILSAVLLGCCFCTGLAGRASHAASAVPSGFFIEAEQYDYAGGQFVQSVNIMPYTGNEYDGLGAVHDIDYHQTEDRNVLGMTGYRLGDVPNVPMDRQVDAGTLDVQRGGFTVSQNYKIAWANEGDWYNYTRTFTNGNYTIFATQSHGDSAGTPNRLRLRIATVTAEGVKQFGAFQAPATGEYGFNSLNQFMNGPVPAIVHLSGTMTLRVYQDEGDFDWFVLVPTTNSLPAENFIIEAEDFNYGGGQTKAQASVMPLSAGLYEGLSATPEIDYHVAPGGNEGRAQAYRVDESPNVRISDNSIAGMNVRGQYVLSQNQRIWIEGGEWFNYTRSFRPTNYHVFAALSHAENGPTSGSLHLVTQGTNSTNQNVVKLGAFNVPGGTGGWGANRFAALNKEDGTLAAVSLNGTQTLRYLAESGDFDYLVFVPTDDGLPALPQEVRLKLTPSGIDRILVTWEGGGRLQTSAALGSTANWQAVGEGGSVTLNISGGRRFFRVVR